MFVNLRECTDVDSVHIHNLYEPLWLRAAQNPPLKKNLILLWYFFDSIATFLKKLDYVPEFDIFYVNLSQKISPKRLRPHSTPQNSTNLE